MNETDLYLVRLDYQALLADGRAVALSQNGEVAAIDAEAALLEALVLFRDEREKRPEVVKVWNMRATVALVSDNLRQDLEKLLRDNAPESSDKFTGHNDKNGSPIHEGDQVSDGHSVYAVHWDAKQSKWSLVRVSGAYRYPPFHQVVAMVKVSAS
jgi:hypothetical protein